MDNYIITLKNLFEINKDLVERYGGCGVGFKDKNLAISAIEGCNQEVFGIVLYPTILSKINHLVYSIIANHVFLDGNKRTGSFIFNSLVKKYNLKLNIDLEYYILSIAKSKFNEEEALNYLKSNTLI